MKPATLTTEHRRHTFRLIPVRVLPLFALITSNSALVHAQATFTPLGTPDVRGISADGSTAIGFRNVGRGPEAYRWTAQEGTVGLGSLPGGRESVANAVSGDGSIIVGTSQSSAVPRGQAFYWTREAGMVPLDFGLPSEFSIAWDVSADGNVIVGQGDFGLVNRRRAFRWTSKNKSELIEPPFPRDFSGANSVSADGNVVVGEIGWPVEVFRWTEADGLKLLGDLPGGDFYSLAKNASADGSIIVGAGTSENSATWEAFRWTSGTGMIGLGDLPGGDFDSIGWGISADGSVVVGSSRTNNGSAAFLWTQAAGMLHLQDFLIDRGADMPAGWHLTSATGISADGLTVVGTGMNPAGQHEAWVATIPEPSTFALAAFAAVGLIGSLIQRLMRMWVGP